jgi:hypothetical protein
MLSCLFQKKNGKYSLIISALSTNLLTLADARMLPNLEEFSEGFAVLLISSLTDFQSGYDQTMLHKDSGDYMAFQTTQGMYLPTRLLQGGILSVLAFV